jgi:hypothetical protein
MEDQGYGEACAIPTEQDKEFLEEGIVQYDLENKITLNNMVEGIVQSVLEEEGNRDAYTVESAKITLNETERRETPSQRTAMRKSPYGRRPKRGGMKGGGKLKYLRIVSKLLALIIYLGVTYGIYTGISWAVGLIVAKISASIPISENTMDQLYESCVSIFKPKSTGKYYLTEQEAAESALGGIVKPVKSVVRSGQGLLGRFFGTVQEENPLYEGQMNAYDMAYQGLLKQYNAWMVYRRTEEKRQFVDSCVSGNMIQHLNGLISQIVTLVSLVGTSGVVLAGGLAGIIRKPYVFMEEKIYFLLTDMVNDYNVIDSIMSGDVSPDITEKLYERRPTLRGAARERAVKLLKSRGMYTEFVREGEGEAYTNPTPDYRNAMPPDTKEYIKANKRAEELFGMPEQFMAKEEAESRMAQEEAIKRQAAESTYNRTVDYYKSIGMEPPLPPWEQSPLSDSIQKPYTEMNRKLYDPYGAAVRPDRAQFLDEAGAYSQYYSGLANQQEAQPPGYMDQPPTYDESMEQAAFEEMSGGRRKKQTKRKKHGGKKKTIRRRKAKSVKGKRRS